MTQLLLIRLLPLKLLLLLLPRRLLRLTLLRWKPLLRAMLLLRPRRQLKLLHSNCWRRTGRHCRPVHPFSPLSEAAEQ